MEAIDQALMTPEEVAQWLRDSGLAEGDVLDLLREAGERYGWNVRLDEAGLRYLKPDVPADKDARHE